MTTRKLTTLAVALVLAVSLIAFIALRSEPVTAAAVDNHDGNTCGAKGTYGYVGLGTTFDNNALGFPPGLASTNGTITLDGNGHWFVREAEVANGVLLNSAATFGGNLTINPDCTFVATLPPLEGPALVGVVVDNGNQVRAMSTIPGVQVSYVATVKIHTDDSH
jgi:hypothetical protein